MKRLRELLERELDTSAKMVDFARMLRVNPFVLARRFKREIGMTPHAYRLELRVLRACELLSRGVSPANVAVEIGFCDQGHLGRVFKRKCGVTPGQYARGHRQT